MAEDKSRNALNSALLSAFRSVTNSELTIVCGWRRWKAHQNLLCSGSKFFEKALNGGFKEGETNVIELKEEDPELVDRMLLYLYTLDYPTVITDNRTGLDAVKNSPESDAPAVLHAKMYALADKYGLDKGLKALCKTKFQAEAEAGWKNETFVDACILVFTSTPESDRGLRDVVVEVVVINAEELMQSKKFSTELKEMGTLATESLADIVLKRRGPLPTMLYCDSHRCKANFTVECSNCNFGSHVSPAR